MAFEVARLPLGKRVLRAMRRAVDFGHARLARTRCVTKPPPLDGRKVCLLASFSKDGRVAARTRSLCKAWRSHGYTVVLVVALDDPRRFVTDGDEALEVDGLLVRRNLGYDFGSWGSAVRALGGLREASIVAMANDSVYGPLRGFAAMLARVDHSTADVIGLTESFQTTLHLQSYLVFYKSSALKSRVFERFWRAIRAGDRQRIIETAELPLLSIYQRGGLEVEVLFPMPRDPRSNPTLIHWRELIDAGFPFIKVQLLRENPYGVDLSGWPRMLEVHGYDPAVVAEDLGTAFTRSAAGATFETRRPPEASPAAVGDRVA